MARMFALHLTQHLLHKQLSFLPQYKIIYVKHLEPNSYKLKKKSVHKQQPQGTTISYKPPFCNG